MTTATTLAEAFAAIVRRDLRAHLVEINQRNASPDYVGACATHDFCDANMLMLEAYESAIGPWQWDSEESTALANQAWGIARKSGFSCGVANLHDVARTFMERHAQEGAKPMSLDEWLAEYGESLPPHVVQEGYRILSLFD